MTRPAMERKLRKNKKVLDAAETGVNFLISLVKIKIKNIFFSMTKSTLFKHFNLETIFHIIAYITFSFKIQKCFLLEQQSLTQLKPKVFSICHQHRARPVCTSMQCYQALYRCLRNLKSKIDNGLFQKW